jgi:type I restriction enzyme R subunit
MYAAEDIQGALTQLDEEHPKLADRHQRVVAVFTEREITDLANVDVCVDVLADPKVRAEFVVKFKRFSESLDIVLPRPEALPYVRDARLLGFIKKAAANLYCDGQMNLLGTGQKVRRLIDEYIEARGVNPKVPPISILDADFAQAVDAHRSLRAKASEMKHAARYHISVPFRDDPAYYKRLSERLEAILQNFRDNWEELVAALRDFTEDVRCGRPEDATGLDPRTQAPFLGVLVEEADQPVSAERLQQLAAITVELVTHVQQEIRTVDFWRNLPAQNVLRSWIVTFLDSQDAVPYARLRPTADRLVDLAKALHTRLVA